MAVVEQSPDITEVVAITQHLFDCAPVFEVLSDPEDPESKFVVVTVECQGEPSELLAKRIEWHSRMRSVSAERFGNLRLTIIPLPCNPANS